MTLDEVKRLRGGREGGNLGNRFSSVVWRLWYLLSSSQDVEVMKADLGISRVTYLLVLVFLVSQNVSILSTRELEFGDMTSLLVSLALFCSY